MLVRMLVRVRLQSGKHARFRAGGDDDIFGLECLDAGFRFHFHLQRAATRALQNGRIALHPVDLVLLHQELDALGMLRDDLVFAIQHLGVIELRVFALDPLVGGVHEVFPQVGCVEQRLGRDAAHMQTGAAEFGIFFDDRGLQAVLAGADRRGVAPGAAPNHNQVISHLFSG